MPIVPLTCANTAGAFGPLARLILCPVCARSRGTITERVCVVAVLAVVCNDGRVNGLSARREPADVNRRVARSKNQAFLITAIGVSLTVTNSGLLFLQIVSNVFASITCLTQIGA